MSIIDSCLMPLSMKFQSLLREGHTVVCCEHSQSSTAIRWHAAAVSVSTVTSDGLEIKSEI